VKDRTWCTGSAKNAIEFIGIIELNSLAILERGWGDIDISVVVVDMEMTVDTLYRITDSNEPRVGPVHKQLKERYLTRQSDLCGGRVGYEEYPLRPAS
jgi:hypothetical protein